MEDASKLNTAKLPGCFWKVFFDPPPTTSNGLASGSRYRDRAAAAQAGKQKRTRMQPKMLLLPALCPIGLTRWYMYMYSPDCIIGTGGLLSTSYM